MIFGVDKRKYTLRRRAEQQDDTRRRIVEAAIALHEEIGPRNTTVSAIAERAGVQRLTVYRHFPDESAVIQACSSTWMERHPQPPLPDPGAALSDPDWVQHALLAQYRYNRATAGMWTSVLRDAGQVQALDAPLTELADYMKLYGDAILARLRHTGEPSPELRAAVALALSFATWSTLAAQGLVDEPMARLMASWLCGLADA